MFASAILRPSAYGPQSTAVLQFSSLHLARRFSTFRIGGLAQLVEQLTLNQRVGGSSPPASTLKILVTFIPRVTIFSQGHWGH